MPTHEIDIEGFTVDFYVDGLVDITYSTLDSDSPMVRINPGHPLSPPAARAAIRRAFTDLGNALAEQITQPEELP